MKMFKLLMAGGVLAFGLGMHAASGVEVLNGADNNYLLPHIASPASFSGDLPVRIERGLKEAARAALRGSRGDLLNNLIVGWGITVDNAKSAVDLYKQNYENLGFIEKIKKGKVYRTDVRRVVRRLKIIDSVIEQILQGTSRQHALHEMSERYASSYEIMEQMLADNLNKVRVFEDFEKIRPGKEYLVIGIPIEDRREFDAAQVRGLIDAYVVAQNNSAAAEAYKRQMGYIFSDDKRKETYDAWLDGKQEFEAWQNSELAALNLDVGALNELSMGVALTLANNEELQQLRNKIARTILAIERETYVRGVA